MNEGSGFGFGRKNNTMPQDRQNVLAETIPCDS